VVTVLAAQTEAVLEVVGIAPGRRFHTGRMAVPGGVTYLVVTPPAGPRGVTAALGDLCARYDPRVVVLVDSPSGAGDVVLAYEREPVAGAVSRFFAAAGEPASLPGYGGDAPFQVSQGSEDGEMPSFCADATTRHGKPLAWAVIRGGTGAAADRNAAQTLRYLIPYLRPRISTL
jgi:hypothetical protein